MIQIFVFGDSGAYGMWDVEGGWVGRLRKRLDGESLKSGMSQVWEIFNLSVSGTTSEDILKRMSFEYRHRAWEKAQTAIILAVGINDSIREKGSPWYTPDQFKKNIDELCRIAQGLTSRVVYIGLTPVDQAKVDPIPWDTTRSYKNDAIEQFNQIIKAVCAKRKIDFVDLWPVFQKNEYIALLQDGAHSNNRGHELIYRTVLRFLSSTGIIEGID